MEQQVRSKIVDSNEPGDMRYKLLELGWEQRKLYSGDYWFFTHDYLKVGITRKEIGDLFTSIGEVFSKQLEEFIEHYDIRIMLLEGSWKRTTTEKMVHRGIEYFTWDMIWNYIRRWQDKGVTLELTMNEGHTINRLNKLYALYQKPYSLSANTRKFTDDRVLAFPSGCRGKTGELCLTEFGNLATVAQANPHELQQIEGVGEKKAMSIWNHFNRGGNKQCLESQQTM